MNDIPLARLLRRTVQNRLAVSWQPTKRGYTMDNYFCGILVSLDVNKDTLCFCNGSQCSVIYDTVSNKILIDGHYSQLYMKQGAQHLLCPTCFVREHSK